MLRMDEHDALPLHSWSIRKLLWLLVGVAVIAVIGFLCAALLRSSANQPAIKVAPISQLEKEQLLNELNSAVAQAATQVSDAEKNQILDSLGQPTVQNSPSVTAKMRAVDTLNPPQNP